jgi:nucleotide-binding universal stress UspA family protein
VYKKILYPINFEEFSLDVLSCILNFRKAGMKEIVLLHVLDIGKLPVDKFEGYSREDADRARAVAEIKMNEAVRVIEQAEIKAGTRIVVGYPYREIINTADQEKVSLIVSGRQKRGVLGEIFIGSNTDKVIRYGKVPVYVPKFPGIYSEDKQLCKRICENLFTRVLYPTDWSDRAEEALRYLEGLREAGVEEVVVTHIMDEKAIGLLPHDKLEEFEEIDREKLEKVRQELEHAGFKVSTRLHMGKPKKDLIEIARQEDISLIVMGAHGKGYVEGVLWGSVSRHLVEYSDRPVLLVKGK